MNNEQVPTWNNQLIAARAMRSLDLRRHAAVSVDNRHRCQDCFCCAAVEVLEARTRAWRNKEVEVSFGAPPVSTGYWGVDSWVNFVDWSLPGNAKAAMEEETK